MSNEVSTGNNSGCILPIVLVLIPGFFLLASTGRLPNLRPILEHLLSSTSGWVVTTNDGFLSSKISQKCTKYLNVIDDQDQQIKQVAFTLRGECVILTAESDHIYYDVSDLPEKMVERLETSQSVQGEVRFIEFGISTEWVVVLENNDAYGENIPVEMVEKIKSLQRKNVAIQNIAFAPNGGWIILTEQSIFSSNIEQNLINEILKLRSSKHLVKQIEFAPDRGWLMLVDKNSFVDNNIPIDMLNHLKTLQHSEQEIISVGFVQLKQD